MPRRIQNFVKSELLKDRFEQQAFRAFSRTNPTVLKTLASGISDLEHQPGEMMILLRGTIARYQLGVETTPNDELLCLDGYFTQRAESILWREPGREFSLEAYLNAIPTPSLLIYVKAPVGTCLDRQRDRRRVVGSRPWVEDVETAQTHLHELCANIADAQRTRTTVVEVENNGSVDEAVKRVESAIQRAQSADMRATNSF